MLPKIIEEHSTYNNYEQRRFRLQWTVNGSRHGRSWNFNDSNRNQRQAEVEAFRKELIRQTPPKISYSERRKGMCGTLFIRWTDDTPRTKSFNFTEKSYADQKAKSLAFKDQLEVCLKDKRNTM